MLLSGTRLRARGAKGHPSAKQPGFLQDPQEALDKRMNAAAGDERASGSRKPGTGAAKNRAAAKNWMTTAVKIWMKPATTGRRRIQTIGRDMNAPAIRRGALLEGLRGKPDGQARYGARDDRRLPRGDFPQSDGKRTPAPLK